MPEAHVLAIDEGTTSTRCMCFDAEQKVLSNVQFEFKQYFPRPGWVEHDPDEIWQATVRAAKEAMMKAGLKPSDITAVGITNQRETTVLWDRETGKVARPAIVWQCRRSADTCTHLKEQGQEEMVHSKTGLLLDPYFSGTKLSWIMENEPGTARRARAGELAFGTIDSFLLNRMTAGKVHATDYSNASRTLLFNLRTLAWDPELTELLGVPASLLPEVKESSGVFGITDPASFAGIEAPVAGIAGDQQAALFGQACFHPGMTKNTYGTGSFVLMNIGEEVKLSRRGLLTTVAWGLDGKVSYALEGAIFITGAAIQWLRDGLQMIKQASEMNDLAASVPDTDGVYFVPGLRGPGRPLLGPGGARPGHRHDPRHQPPPPGAGGGGMHGLPDGRRGRADAGGVRRQACGAASGRRRLGDALPPSVSGGPAGRDGAAAGDTGDHRARRGPAGGPGHRSMEGSFRDRGALGAGPRGGSRC